MSRLTTPRSSDGHPANIVLIGLSGSGKSTVARLVAERLGWTAVDTDELIERDQGVPITTIFAERGEPAFRAIEASTVAAVTADRQQVIATGGGAPQDPRNRERLWSHGLVVYLRTSVDALTDRLISAGSDDRPLLAGDIHTRLAKLSRERACNYERAHIVIDTDGLAPTTVADKVVEAYEDQR